MTKSSPLNTSDTSDTSDTSEKPESQPASTGKHTPGPWLTDESSENGSIPIRDVRNGYMICRVNPTDDAELEDHANARLIAASPELLKALHAIATVGEDYETCSPVQHKLKLKGAASLARAAITKTS